MKKSEMIESLVQCFHEYIDHYSLEDTIEKMLDRATRTHEMSPPPKFEWDKEKNWEVNEWEDE